MKKLVSCAILACSLSSVAQASIVNATGEGFCNGYGQCSTAETTAPIASDFAGYIYTRYNNWFSFNLPTAATIGVINTATISIYNYGNGFNTTLSAADTFDLYQAKNTSSYDGLMNGPVLGSISAAAANAGGAGWVSISLNSFAITALNQARGGTFIFGGNYNTTDPNLSGKFYGVFSEPYLKDTPGGVPGLPAAQLSLNAPIPEPEEWALLLVGAGLVACQVRRRQNFEPWRLSSRKPNAGSKPKRT
jgi:hypothetical protein